MSTYSDGKRSQLRTMIASVDRALAKASPEAESFAVTIRSSWSELVAALDLGPEPEVRTCPTCGEVGMRAATRCGRCWSPLAPLAPLPSR